MPLYAGLLLVVEREVTLKGDAVVEVDADFPGDRGSSLSRSSLEGCDGDFLKRERMDEGIEV
jgi:hypothetical protein